MKYYYLGVTLSKKIFSFFKFCKTKTTLKDKIYEP